MANLHLKVITPKKVVLEEDVQSVTVPSSEGELTILPYHTNLFSLLKEGIVRIKKDNREDYLAIGGGYAETDGKNLNVLVSRAYGQNEIDEQLTQKAMDEAKKAMAAAKDKNQRAEAISLLRRSVIDMKLLKKRKARII